jgi:hypothetical protein
MVTHIESETIAMLGMKAYPNDYINSCRAKVNADLAAPTPEFEASYFNNLLVLDVLSMHRLRTLEGKDGDPLNEVRMLVDAILLHDCFFTTDKAIKLTPACSVLGFDYGDNVALSEAQFVSLPRPTFTRSRRVSPSASSRQQSAKPAA